MTEKNQPLDADINESETDEVNIIDKKDVKKDYFLVKIQGHIITLF